MAAAAAAVGRDRAAAAAAACISYVPLPGLPRSAPRTRLSSSIEVPFFSTLVVLVWWCLGSAPPCLCLLLLHTANVYSRLSYLDANQFGTTQ